MKKDTVYMLGTLNRAGISPVHAIALRRIAMTLHNWHEKECGSSDNRKSWAIERDEVTDTPYIVEHWHVKAAPGGSLYSNTNTYRRRIPDLEKGALKRLDAIMSQYPDLSYYIQTDPRGAPLYILRKGDIPEGKDVDAYYSNGLAVYK